MRTFGWGKNVIPDGIRSETRKRDKKVQSLHRSRVYTFISPSLKFHPLFEGMREQENRIENDRTGAIVSTTISKILKKDAGRSALYG